MMLHPAVAAALWGIVGGFAYAGPKFSACLYTAKKGGNTWGMCALDLVIGLLTSCGVAAAFGPWVIAQEFSLLGKSGAHQIPAVGCLIGYGFNQLGPALLRDIRKRLTGASDGKTA